MLKVNIEDLTFQTIIGILDFERETKQKVVINLSFEYFYNEDGSNFIDYSEVALLVETTMIEKEFKLIEDAIIYLRKIVKDKYDISNLTIKISKPDILSNCVVSVEE